MTRGHAYRTFDWATCTGMVDGVMAGYPTPEPPAGGTGTNRFDLP